MVASDILLDPRSNIRLYTWLDVEEVLLRFQEKNQFPSCLVWVRTYWDSLTIGIRPGTQAEVKNWLGHLYDPRFRIDTQDPQEDGLIILESRQEVERTLPVIFEETDEDPPVPRLIPSLAASKCRSNDGTL